MSDPYVPPVIADLLAAVEAQPHEVAVADRHLQVTYAELAHAATGVAHRLLATSVGPSVPNPVPVPVVVGRDVGTVFALFGVLLAGRSFVAIERTDPPGRIAEVIERVGADIGMARADDLHLLGAGLASLAVEDCPPAEHLDLTPEVHDDDLAAVVFTSGSTGRPKGVRLDHSNFTSMQARSQVRADEGPGPSPAMAPFSFLAGLTTLGHIATGNRVHLVTPAEWDPIALLEWFDEQRFTQVSVVPSFARSALEHWPEGRCLEHVVRLATYGEALRWSDVPALRRLAPGARIAVSYGASEASGGVCNLSIAPGDDLGDGPMPLGVPQPDRRVTLEALDPTDPGSPREIVVYGNISPGYWDDPELDAARFGVGADGERFWRSGDLGEWVDGAIVHRGRVDELVKIGGRLVEPAEAERVLAGLDGVVQAVVLGQRVGHGVRLVGHVEPARLDGRDAVGPDELRAAMAEVLPAALVPSVLVRHDRLPINARGKADRAGLRAAPVVPWRTGTYVAPVPELEWVVVGHALEILGYTDETLLGRDDDLFTLGLDSLGATELIAALDDAGLGPLTPADLLECPTPRLLAERCARPRAHVGAGRSGGEPVTYNVDGTRAPWFAVAGAGGTALAYRDLARRLGPDQPLVVLENPGLHDGRAVPPSVEAAAAVLLDDLRTVLAARGERSGRADGAGRLPGDGVAGGAAGLPGGGVARGAAGLPGGDAGRRADGASLSDGVGGSEPDGDGPPVLMVMGHSWGGLVAYEMAQRLEGQSVGVRLVLLDTAVLWAGTRAEQRRRALAAMVRDPRRVVASVRWRLDRLRERRAGSDAWSGAGPGASGAGSGTGAGAGSGSGAGAGAGTGAGSVATQAAPGDGDADGRAVVERYMAAFHHGIETGRRYRPPRSTVAVTVVEVAGSGAGASWAPYADEVAVVAADGTHNSMLNPPHTEGLAATLGRLT
ncbi:AMP-binding protein [Rhabdothermincola salaria]|uniref:AMP-binding protein n=1 Tax=Rhabdothermincola salaria TaxID=2903142 RepID=UPI001E4E921A|nr:AMP-binding protein [Rhabdothermincola salaria]